MADVHSKKTRSYNMSQIKGKDTKPEILVRKFLYANGFRYRLYTTKLPGKPDIVLTKLKTVILINGCFWHGHKNCRYFKIPSTRTEFWKEKISSNVERDKKNSRLLKAQGWQILTIFECQLKGPKLPITLEKLLTTLKSVKTL